MTNTNSFQNYLPEHNLDECVQLIEVFRKAILDDPATIVQEPWDAFVIIMSFEPGMRTNAASRYDGIACAPATRQHPRKRNIAFKHDLHSAIRDAMDDPEKGRFHTWVTLYNGQDNTWKDWFYWPDDNNPWIQHAFQKDNEYTAAQNPIDPDKLTAPFSAELAGALSARYRRRNGIKVPSMKREERQADRLDGGYRIYKRADGQPATTPLESINAAHQGAVALVADNLEVDITTTPIDQHQTILNDLNTRHPIPQPGLWII